MSDRIRTLVVDDEPVARRLLRRLLSSEPEIEVIGEAASGPAAVKAIAEQRPDLVFLDVQMPGLDGFGVLRATTASHQPFVVFVTAHDEHAIRAFDVEAVDYLLKPVDETRLRVAVRRAVRRLRDGSRKDLARELARFIEHIAPPAAGTVTGAAGAGAGRIPIKRDGRVTFVRVEDIDWVEADGDLIRLHAGAETHVARMTMADVAEKLPRNQFVRIHRSTIVRADRVREVQPWFKGDYMLIMRDGARLRSGRTYREAVQALIK